VRSRWAGRGIATASARLVAGFGFEHLGLNRVEIVAAQENVASIRVAEKAGARKEGRLRRRITVRDRIYDAVLFSLIPEELVE
jgi:ribosomal-protein-serine acetyltransferase